MQLLIYNAQMMQYDFIGFLKQSLFKTTELLLKDDLFAFLERENLTVV